MRSPYLFWSSRQSAVISLVGALFGLGMVFILSYQVSSSYNAEVQRSRQGTETLAQVLEGQLSSALRETDLVLHDLAQRLNEADVAKADLGETRNKELQGLLLDKLALIRQADNIALVNPQAAMTHRALDTTGGEGLIDRDYFAMIRDNPFQERVYSRLVVANDAQKQGIVVARRYEKSDNQFGGLVVASLTTQYFDRLLGTIDVGHNGNILLLDDHMGIIASYPKRKNAAVFKPDANMVAQLNNGSLTGTQLVQSRTDSATRQTSYRLIAGTPFVIIVSVSSEDYLAHWRDATIYYLLGGGALLCMALLMTYFFWRSHRLARNLQQKEIKLNASEARFRQMIETTPVALVLAKLPDYFITYVNQRAADLFDMPQAAALSMRAFELYLNRLDFMDQVERLHDGKTIRAVEMRLQRHSGEPFWGSVSLSEVNTSESSTVVLGIVDITERKQMESELQRRATTDSLSGLYNRAHFMETANQELARAQRYARPLSLLMVDIDHFKRINDTYGHDVGDKAIRALSDICRGVLRDVDLLARLGGEEFAALLPETPRAQAFNVAERLRLAIEANCIITDDGQEVRFTSSIGITELRANDPLVDDLLKRADTALYYSKHHGRNRVSIAEEIDEHGNTQV
ncbi:PAS domain S-box-containing protein/diguanylate cyclase (GGDEF) domain-containing protein [Andreprevotia lacus DSM 23236]|jgi:diguanylate cyclase (GGDEF)-like protein/PAS domain S-box-containing protein|uniref:diguanylate cyclase n=1 Tax=Andreprevotia lacus DSM 23236 TaxID=1121001 RepID=A0A1W1WZ71_9NEIS|nr:diguanylate cyclase [Andreprevotia lacus]SMC16903.1 PAS domain S-box-containing protein/diguanylate cyclase (GGDEF) domain-containing protein [Andreprevotia lacus DSM 23236]